MSVSLISSTPNGEERLMYVARVSNPSNRNSGNSRLLAYCMKHGHWSVFEHAHMTLEIETSRAVSAQLIRHRSFTFQEFSQRYAQPTGFLFTAARRQDTTNRQNSIDDLPFTTKDWFMEKQREVFEHAKQVYDEALNRGIAKECARMVLPMATKTTICMTGNVRSWVHYLLERTKPSTQYEHRAIALKAEQVFADEYPTVYECYKQLKLD